MFLDGIASYRCKVANAMPSQPSDDARMCSYFDFDQTVHDEEDQVYSVNMCGLVFHWFGMRPMYASIEQIVWWSHMEN